MAQVHCLKSNPAETIALMNMHHRAIVQAIQSKAKFEYIRLSNPGAYMDIPFEEN